MTSIGSQCRIWTRSITPLHLGPLVNNNSPIRLSKSRAKPKIHTCNQMQNVSAHRKEVTDIRRWLLIGIPVAMQNLRTDCCGKTSHQTQEGTPMAAIESTARQHRNQSTASTHHLSPAGAASPSGARLGHILGSRYRLERLLGKGAMGEVYRAMDLQRGEPCAVKLVLPDANWTLQAQRRLVQEVKVISRLYHPNVVEVRDFFQDNDGTYLVMELLHGVDLLSLIRT